MVKSLRFFMLLSFLLITKMAFSQEPVASYLFSGNAFDEKGNHASVKGAKLTNDRFGRANNAFLFDGQQSFVEAQNNDALNTDYTSVSFWVKPNALPGQGEVYLISFGGWQERFKISVPTHGKCIWTTNNSSGISDMDAGDGNELVVGEWKHLVFVHDGTKDLIYVNGQLAAEKAVQGTLNSTSHNFGIGYDAVDKGNFFNGTLDDVMVFGSALSASEIDALYTAQSTSPVTPQGIVASYGFDGNALDQSNYANHASLLGGAVSSVDRFGFGNHAITLDASSNSGVVASNSSTLNSAYTTISFWVNPKSLVGGGEAFLLSNGGWQERWKISLPNHGKPVFTTHANGSCCSDMDAGTPLALGEWTHVVMVHDGTKDIIYYNGVQVNEKSVLGELDATNYPLGIGFDPIDNAGYFDGSIDDVLIYNYALSPTEINALFVAQNTNPGSGSDLVAEYKLNGDGIDATEYENNGNYGGAATSNRFNWANNATTFTGEAGSAVIADNSPALQSDFTTISFWVNPTVLPGSGEVFLLSNGGWQERWKISLPSHGKPVFTTHSNGVCCSDMDSGTPLTTGTWTHVVMTHDGTKDIIYFNGAKVNEKDVAGALDKTSHPLGIGFDPIDFAGYFNGSMDDVQIYNRALSEGEVAALYDLQNQTPAVGGDLIANYPFNNNSKDITEYANHATGSAIFTKDRFGKINQAYTFNGAANLEAANSPQQNSAYTTISFWVNPNTLPGSGEVFLLSNGGWQERWKISLPNHGKPVFTTHANGACCSDMDSGTPLSTGVWTHVAMTHDGTKDIIYFNGAKVNEKDVAGTLDATTKPLGIGFDPIDRGSFFDGSIDEVQIYGRALSDVEIAALYAEQNTDTSTDNETPTPPLDLTASVSFTTITLNWLPSSDNVGVVQYNVYQDGVLAYTTSATQQIIENLPQLTDFIFGVSAVDESGNESFITLTNAKSGEDQTPDTTPPTAPGNLQASAGANSVLLSWDASTDDRGVEAYVVLVDGTIFDTLESTQTSVFIGGLDSNTPYTLEVYAYDKAGNDSEISSLDVTTEDEVDTGEPGLVAHYPFEGNANDATPYQNHGVPGGDVSYINADHPNGGAFAVKFDGNADSILAPNAVQLISDYTTVAFWIRVDEQNIADAESYILDFGHWDQRWKISLPQHLKIVWTTNSKNAQFPVFISDMDSGDGNELVKSFWWHVVMTHDGTEDRIYVNGALAKSKPTTGTLNPTGRSLGMGGNPIEGGQYFNGALDELKIYNKALALSEVEKLYNDGTVGIFDLSPEGLKGYIESVYPIPSKEDLWISHNFEGNQNIVMRVFDGQGRQVDQIAVDKNQIKNKLISIKTINYVAGNYYLNFVANGRSLGAVPFVKQ